MNLVCLKCGAQLNTGGNCIAGCPSPVIGTNCVWCGRGFPDGAPPLADHIAALEAELAAERERREEAREDAERYRWLRENCREVWDGHSDPVQLIHYEPHTPIHGWEERLDAAIDAARKERT